MNHCRRELEKLKLIKPPVIHLDASLGAEEVSRMKEVVTKMGGQLAAGDGAWDCVPSAMLTRLLDGFCFWLGLDDSAVGASKQHGAVAYTAYLVWLALVWVLWHMPHALVGVVAFTTCPCVGVV